MLDEVPQKFRDIKPKEGYENRNIESIKRLFPDSHYNKRVEPNAEKKVISERINNCGLSGRIHHKVPIMAATRDNIAGIFNSRTNKNTITKEITPKPNIDNFQTFSASAKKICEDRYNGL